MNTICIDDFIYVDNFSKAVIDTIRDIVIKNEPEKLDNFNDDVEFYIFDNRLDDTPRYNPNFREALISDWGVNLDLEFGFDGWGLYVEVAKRYPEFKEQAGIELKYNVERRNDVEWSETCLGYLGDDLNDIAEEVEEVRKDYDELKNIKNILV